MDRGVDAGDRFGPRASVCLQIDAIPTPISLFLKGAILLGLAMSCGAALADTDGVRHRIDATVAIEPQSPLLRSADAKGSLSFSVRISANSMEVRYFGVLSPVFSDIVIPRQAANLIGPRKIWEEDKCHQRRGMPKVTVTLLQGAFQAGDTTFAVMAPVRHIGIAVPPDELTPGIKLPPGNDDIGPYYAIRAQSRDSKLNVDLKIYAFGCRF